MRRPSTSTAAAAADGGASGKYRIAVYIASISGTGVIVEEEIEQVCRRCGLYDEGGGSFHPGFDLLEESFFFWFLEI